MATFYETITAAINDIVNNGFDTQKRVVDWMAVIRKAATESLTPEQQVDQAVRAYLKQLYERQVVKGGILKFHDGMSRFTLDMVKPKLRNELDRRIMANAQLIKLNREIAIENTLRRFSGWATSIPAGGSRAAAEEKKDTKEHIRKTMANLPFEERRVAIDQGHKFVASLNSIIALDRGALCAVWHSHWRRPGYNYRPDHKERDLKVYAIRDNWAIQKGLMKVGPHGYTDQITQPGEEVYCSCTYQYVYNITAVPDNMLTERGKREIEKALIS
jgi:hypothetical protein